MTDQNNFIEKAKSHFDELGAELSEIERKVVEAGENADAWSTTQFTKLKQDLEDAKSEMTNLATNMEKEGEEKLNEAKQKAESHWDALKAAVKTYRGHVEDTISK